MLFLSAISAIFASFSLVKYPIDYNLEAIKTLIRRAMDMGFYEGVNLSLAYCDDCGHQELEMDVCPKCGSRNLTKIDRTRDFPLYNSCSSLKAVMPKLAVADFKIGLILSLNFSLPPKNPPSQYAKGLVI